MMTVLTTSDEVDQLVLRNTDLTDDHLLSLSRVLKSSPSEVTMLNLNLNLIGPYGAHILLDVLRAKPQVKSLHLFGNRLRDHGVLTLLAGVAELQAPAGGSPLGVFTLLELDVGANGLGSDGVRVLASYLRSHSRLRYLGLARTPAADLAAWRELFQSLRGDGSLVQIVLDQNNLGDPGVRLLADALRENGGLQQVDLDGNAVSDVGGNDIMAALLCRRGVPLRRLSLQENNISAGLMSRIQEQVEKRH
ncbi:ribonuclease inhibitor [Menidia menidia]